MKDWPSVPLGELCELINGRAFKPSDWQDAGLPIVRIQNLNDSTKPFNHFNGRYSEKHLIDDGSILLSWSGTPGTSFGCFRWQGGPALLNQHIFKVIVENSRIDGDFFIHAVNSRLEEMIDQSHGGVGLRHITKAKLVGISLPCPPLPEQRRIVARIKECMARVDEIEALRGESRSETKAFLRSYYHDLYEDLVASRATCPLESCGTIRGGGTPSKKRKDYWDGPIPWVSPREMKARNIRETTLSISEQATRETSVKPIEKPSVLFVVRGMILAHTLPVAVNRVPVTLNQDMKAITPQDEFNVGFLAMMLRGAERRILRKIDIAGHGTRRLQTEHWKSLPIPELSLDEQEAIVAKVESVESAVDALTGDINAPEVSQLRESILRKAFAGEL